MSENQLQEDPAKFVRSMYNFYQQYVSLVVLNEDKDLYEKCAKIFKRMESLRRFLGKSDIFDEETKGKYYDQKVLFSVALVERKLFGGYDTTE